MIRLVLVALIAKAQSAQSLPEQFLGVLHAGGGGPLGGSVVKQCVSQQKLG